MMRELREKFRKQLSRYTLGVLCAVGDEVPLAMPVACRAQDLHVLCLVPRWAELAYFLEAQAPVMLILPEAGDSTAWIQIIGHAIPVAAEQWEDPSAHQPSTHQQSNMQELYLVVDVTARRFDHFLPQQGWGVRETLELQLENPNRRESNQRKETGE